MLKSLFLMQDIFSFNTQCFGLQWVTFVFYLLRNTFVSVLDKSLPRCLQVWMLFLLSPAFVNVLLITQVAFILKIIFHFWRSLYSLSITWLPQLSLMSALPWVNEAEMPLVSRTASEVWSEDSPSLSPPTAATCILPPDPTWDASLHPLSTPMVMSWVRSVDGKVALRPMDLYLLHYS